jgi:predicted Zn-dependent peptidase
MLYDSTGCFAYAHSVIGSMADLDAAPVEDVQAFFDLYYAPNNATLTVVGDFDPAEAKRLIQQYFGDIPRGRDSPPVECRYRFDVGPMRKTWEDQHANLPAVILAYRTPPHDHADTPALQHLSTILGGGESSRLHRSLVRDAKVAFAAGAQFQSRRGPGVMLVFAIANQGISAEALERQLLAEVARVRDQGISEEEVTKARNDHRAGTIFGIQTTMSVSEQLQHYAHYHSSLDEIHTELDQYLAVTGADIQRVARTYLVPENSLTITVLPKGGANQ